MWMMGIYEVNSNKGIHFFTQKNLEFGSWNLEEKYNSHSTLPSTTHHHQ
jgi:hypothetical protein